MYEELTKMPPVPKVWKDARIINSYRQMVVAGKYLPVSLIDRNSANYKPAMLLRMKKTIARMQGEVVGLVHPRYSEWPLHSSSEGSVVPGYEAHQKKLTDFIRSCPKPILCFMPKNMEKELGNWLKSLKLKSPCIFIVHGDDYYMSPLLAPTRGSFEINAWYKLANILKELGVRRISYVGERTWMEYGKVRGCVPYIAGHLEMFDSHFIDEYIFHGPPQ